MCDLLHAAAAASMYVVLLTFDAATLPTVRFGLKLCIQRVKISTNIFLFQLTV